MHIVPQVDPYPTATMAGAGYAIPFPMPRGGAGYGEAGQRAIVNGWGDADYKDIMAGVDALIAQGIAILNRLGDGGVVWRLHDELDRHADRPLQGGLGRASLSHLSDTFYLSEGGAFLIHDFKRPWENREGYDARPFAADLRGQGDDAAADRARRGRSARADRRCLEILPHAEGDGQDRRARNLPAGRPRDLREPAQQREQMRRNLEWFAKWMGKGS